MKLSEMKRLPKKAGVARLQFGSRAIRKNPPYRNHDLIVLPDEPGAKFYPLLNGKQFLFQDSFFFFRWICRTWFGGTDKQTVFLTRLDNEAVKVLSNKGEKAFYEALKPKPIRKFEKEFGGKPKRQGDIWAILVYHSWEKFLRKKFLNGERAPEIISARGKRILGTRHQITGMYLNDIFEIYGIYGGQPGEHVMLAEGVITSPDHPPIKLKGPHLIAQTALLYDSAKAD